MKITKMVPCIKNGFESALTLNNGGDLTGHFLDVLVLRDGAVEVLWSIQRQPVNVCHRERDQNNVHCNLCNQQHWKSISLSIPTTF